MSRTPSSDVPPPDLPGYRFIKHIGAGGNAQVYLYEQQLPKREVAVKVLNESALSEAARSRFTAEANLTAGLQHRHIVQVFDAKVTEDGRPYIVMPYYPQPNLSVRARRSHFSIADVLRVGIQIGSAVETSHRRGVLHRDIKPQNILTDSYGEPALTDFGIATTTGGDGPEGLSVPWSPPEILLGTAPGDKRSDVYSLGATLWHLLVGRSPFEAPGGDNGHYALTNRIKSDAVPRTQRADVPDSLERLLRRTMAKDPVARPQTAMELIRGLQSIEQEMRLPLTQPILPADGPKQGDTAGARHDLPAASAQRRDHVPRGFGQGPGQPGQPGQPGSPPGVTRASPPGAALVGPAGVTRASRRGDWTPARRPAPRRCPVGARGGAGVCRGQRHPQARSGPDRPERLGGHRGRAGDPRARPGQARPVGSATAPGMARARHFPPEAPEGATLARPRMVAPGGADPFGATSAGFPGRAGGELGRTDSAGPAARRTRIRAGAGGAACSPSSAAARRWRWWSASPCSPCRPAAGSRAARRPTPPLPRNRTASRTRSARTPPNQARPSSQ